jgi:hypothetical protein
MVAKLHQTYGPWAALSDLYLNIYFNFTERKNFNIKQK